MTRFCQVKFLRPCNALEGVKKLEDCASAHGDGHLVQALEYSPLNLSHSLIVL